MSKVKYILFGILVAALIYGCFLVPFTLPKSFDGRKDFVAASTIFGCFITFISVTGNALVCFTLSNGSNVNQPLNFLIITMAIGDLLLPLFYYPINIATHWIYLKDLWLEINVKRFFNAIKYLKCLTYGASCLSILSLTMLTLLQFYQVLRKHSHVPTLLKSLSFIVVLSMSVVICILSYNYMDEEWSHALTATFIYYIPMVAMFSLMLVSFRISERSTTYNEENSDQNRLVYYLFLSYLLLWLPFFSVDVLNEYCCHVKFHHLHKTRFYMENLLMVKGCFNLLLLQHCDKRCKYILINLFKTTCLCYQRTASVQFVDNRDFSIRYSVNDHDVNLELDDERYLIT